MKMFASRFALLALALSAITLAPVVLAQDNASPGSDSSPSAVPQHGAPDPQRQAARLTKRLGLSDDQSAKITTILQNRQQQISTVRGDSSLSQQDRHAKMHSIQQDSDTQINAVLTPAQQTQYTNLKQAMKNRMMQNGHSDGASSNGSSSGSSSSDSGN